MIAGEVNSGKSTFVNAFFREEVTLSDVLPTTETVLWFRHGEPADEPWRDDVIIRRRPTPFLRDFHVVDTPGTNSIVSGHDATTERFLPMADLVVLVLPITNPWSASAWDFLDRLRRQWRKRVVIVLQQADLLDAEAVATVCGRVRGRLHARHGEVLPLFPVSAKLALRAHGTASTEEKRALWESSGFSSVETYLRERVGRYESRLLKMRNTVEAGLSIIRQASAQSPIEEVVNPRTDTVSTEVDAEEKLVQEIDERIDSEERYALAVVPTVVEPLVQRWRELEILLPSQIEERLGIFATIGAVLTGERTPRRVGRHLRGSVGEAGENCHASLLATLRDGGNGRGSRCAPISRMPMIFHSGSTPRPGDLISQNGPRSPRLMCPVALPRPCLIAKSSFLWPVGSPPESPFCGVCSC
ncbi:MAG: dynamin family protein [Verrucomicrobiales bacterium]